MDRSTNDIFRIKILRFGLPKSVPVNAKIGAIPFKLGSNDTMSPLEKAFCDNSLLQLTSEFGKVYVGETLRLTVSLANISQDKVESADISADLYIEKNPSNASQQPAQKDMKNLKTLFLEQVKPLDPYTFSLEFKVDQPYTYFIMFNILYKQEIRILNNQMNNQIIERVQTKRFRFDARMPFNISNCIFKQLDQGKIFAEIKLENTTKSQVYIKSVDMIPVEELEVVPLEKITEHTDVMLNVSEAKKIIFCLKTSTPQAEKSLLANNTASSHTNAVNIGQLYLRWYSITGGFGDLHSKYIAMNVVRNDLELEFKALPPFFLRDKIYALEMRLTNKSSANLDLILTFFEKEMIGLKIIGLSRYDAKLEPGASVNFVMFILPLLEGVQRFQGLRVFNRSTQKEIAYSSLKEIIVKNNEENSDSSNLTETAESLI